MRHESLYQVLLYEKWYTREPMVLYCMSMSYEIQLVIAAAVGVLIIVIIIHSCLMSVFPDLNIKFRIANFNISVSFFFLIMGKVSGRDFEDQVS